jgi:hypothetical protein
LSFSNFAPNYRSYNYLTLNLTIIAVNIVRIKIKPKITSKYAFIVRKRGIRNEEFTMRS